MNTIGERLRLFLNPVDGRFEDLRRGSWKLNVFRDFTAGLIVAMVAIPLAMGFAIASGLNPVHGIVGGAVAGVLGAVFGGSKYQVYGPTAAFIPVIGGIMEQYGQNGYAQGYGFLILVSIIAGLILVGFGLFGLGRYVAMVPHSIVVGFTMGIAATIALSQAGEVLGLHVKLGHNFFEKIHTIAAHISEFNVWALVIAIATFVIIKYLLRVSVYIPAPLIALGAATLASTTFLKSAALPKVMDKYGAIPSDFIHITPPVIPPLTADVIGDIVYFAAAIVFVAAIESLLCSRMADRLAENKGTPFNPDKELWGQGLVNIFVPLLNGFPHTGALARTATNIKLGAISPLAGIFKGVLKLLLAAYLATYLEMVPMACIGGVLFFVAMNMVKPAEVTEVLHHGNVHIFLMVWTALAVLFSDFLTGVLSALVLYGIISAVAASKRKIVRPKDSNELPLPDELSA